MRRGLIRNTVDGSLRQAQAIRARRAQAMTCLQQADAHHLATNIVQTSGMSQDVRQMLYVSNTRRNCSETELNAILTVARAANTGRNITGMLLYLEGAFMQVLEGDDQAVSETFERIKRDPRHWDAQILLDRHGPRAFGEWSMGFERLAPLEHKEGAFQISPSLIMERIDPGALRDLPALIKTFYRVHGVRQAEWT
jgi:hypothetical protein